MTIVVVSYNHERYLPALLASIDAQDLTPQGLVLCDDASQDRSAAILEAYAEASSLPVQCLLNTTNRGLTPTLNDALRRVDTPFYAYISGDDLMRPGRLAVQVPLLEADAELGFVYSDADRVDEDGTDLHEPFSEVYAESWSPPQDTFRALLGENWIPAASVLARTSAVRSVGAYDESLFFEDHDLWLRMSRSWAFTHSDKRLVAFREVEDSLGHTRFREDVEEWHRARIVMVAKHLGIDRATDLLVAERIRPWLLTLVSRGAADRDVVRLLWRVALIRRDLKAAALALLVRAGLPGRAAMLSARGGRGQG